MNFALTVSSEGVRERFLGFFNYIGDAFRDFSFADAIDILVISGILFFVFRFLTNRKAGAVLMGIFLFLVALVLSALFRLSGTYFILSGIYSVGVIALLIIFQPELRDALERIGSGSLSSIRSLSDFHKNKQAYFEAIDNIVSAVSELSRSKTGALIVIVRTTKLNDIMQTGVPINADINSFLLRNLFFNKAPLHDGAVIIDNNRIACAGCLLPLTRRADVDSELGTRHRAAIGMSETSDAVIIVVSEETGTVSVAYDCSLIRNFTSDELRKYLLKYMPKSN